MMKFYLGMLSFVLVAGTFLADAEGARRCSQNRYGNCARGVAPRAPAATCCTPAPAHCTASVANSMTATDVWYCRLEDLIDMDDGMGNGYSVYSAIDCSTNSAVVYDDDYQLPCDEDSQCTTGAGGVPNPTYCVYITSIGCVSVGTKTYRARVGRKLGEEGFVVSAPTDEIQGCEHNEY